MSKYQACPTPEGSNFNVSTSTLHCHSFSLVGSPRLVELHPCGLAPCGDLERAGGTTVEAAFGGGTTAVFDIGCHGGGHADTIGVGWWNGPGILWMLGDAMQHVNMGESIKVRRWALCSHLQKWSYMGNYESSSVFGFMIMIPSWEPGWDMLVPWRVYPVLTSSMWNVRETRTLPCNHGSKRHAWTIISNYRAILLWVYYCYYYYYYYYYDYDYDYDYYYYYYYFMSYLHLFRSCQLLQRHSK